MAGGTQQSMIVQIIKCSKTRWLTLGWVGLDGKPPLFFPSLGSHPGDERG